MHEAHCYYATQITAAVASLAYLSKSVRASGYRRAASSFASACLCCSKATEIAASGSGVVSCLLELRRDFAMEVGDVIYDFHYLC